MDAPLERTLLLIKPDAVRRSLNFQIADRFEKRGFLLVACKMLRPSQALAEKHYAALHGSAAFGDAVGALTSGPAVVLLFEARGALGVARAMLGDSDPSKAEAGTIRGDYAISAASNLVESSADAADAARATAIWFAPEEIGGAPSSAPASAPAAAAASEAQEAQEAEGGEGGEGGKSKRALAKEAKKLEKQAKKDANKKQSSGIPAPPPADKPKIEYEPPSGTRDFFPEEMRERNWLFGKFREVARQFAFQEYDAPVLENEELYKRKGGEEITQQMYNFVDKDGKSVTLRPEMTPTLARMVLSCGGKMLLPVKWYSIPQCWRFETVQRGRKREHYQWNMDIIGEKNVSAEVELLAAITEFFKSVGITSADVGIKVNSRRVLAAILEMYGISNEKFAEVCVIVDKLDKIGPEETIALLVQAAVAKEAASKIVQSLSIRSVSELKELTGDKGGAAVEELTSLFEVAEAYGFADWILFDASVVRGLAYYTGIVFEGFDRKGELRAICGGGRYDKLLSLYGSPEVVPACGFGFGDCVVMELLRDRGLIPPLAPMIDFVVMAFNAEMRPHAVKVAALLRRSGFAIDVLLEPTGGGKKVAKAFSYADRVQGHRVIFVAPDEWATGKVRMKELRKADEKEVDLPFESLVESLTNLGIVPMQSK
ncbi:hypothetical protein AB1Y20_017612 [Prymnesium parvum]|uniref:histidine--tRNA ligase n=1 Tax=Prymnesium parvum TaxID=97485 RepID=A0AB34JPY8_PRYPA